MKHNVNPDTIGQQAEFDAAVSFQDKPLTIAGPADYIVELHSEAESHVQDLNVQITKSAVKHAPRTPKEPETPTYEFPTKREKVAQYFADAKLRKFDRMHDTNLYEQKLEQRRKTAVFLMASEAQLFDRGSDYYKSQLKRLARTAITR